MTGRTTPTRHVEHGLSVLIGGLADTPLTQDEHETAYDAAWLAQEIEAASALCDRLEAQGQRIAFEPCGNGVSGIQVTLRDLIHDELVRELDTRDVLDGDRLMHLNGMGG